MSKAKQLAQQFEEVDKKAKKYNASLPKSSNNATSNTDMHNITWKANVAVDLKNWNKNKNNNNNKIPKSPKSPTSPVPKKQLPPNPTKSNENNNDNDNENENNIDNSNDNSNDINNDDINENNDDSVFAVAQPLATTDEQKRNNIENNIENIESSNNIDSSINMNIDDDYRPPPARNSIINKLKKRDELIKKQQDYDNIQDEIMQNNAKQLNKKNVLIANDLSTK